jgi:hypothetical protein
MRKPTPARREAVRIVRAYLADQGGPEMGWTYEARERDLARAIEQALARTARRVP